MKLLEEKEYLGIKIKIFTEFNGGNENDSINSMDDIIEVLKLLPVSILNILSDNNLIINYFPFLVSRKRIGDYIYNKDLNYKKLSLCNKIIGGKKYYGCGNAVYIPCTNHIFIFPYYFKFTKFCMEKKFTKKHTVIHEIAHFLDNILPKKIDYIYMKKFADDRIKNQAVEDECYISKSYEFQEIYKNENTLYKNFQKDKEYEKKEYYKLIKDPYYYDNSKEFFAESFSQYFYNNEKFKKEYAKCSKYIEKYILNYNLLKYNKIKNNKYINDLDMIMIN